MAVHPPNKNPFDFRPVCLHCDYMKEQGAKSREPRAKPSEWRVASGECRVAGKYPETPTETPDHRTTVPQAGVTLIELLVSIALMVTLAGLFIAGMGYVNKKSALSRAQTEVAVLASAIDNFKLDHGVYPADTNLFVELVGITNGSRKATINTNGKVYIEPTAGMVTDRQQGPFLDPWGEAYLYQTNEKTKEFRNVGFFDLWTTANTNDSKQWIHN